VTESRDFHAYQPMAMRLHEAYNIEYLCTDDYDVYKKYHIGNKHLTTKSETCLVESKNSLLRHYLARFARKTKRYSKAIDMIEASIIILFNKHLALSIII
jgi:insertion element IS1 protein InsB